MCPLHDCLGCTIEQTVTRIVDVCLSYNERQFLRRARIGSTPGYTHASTVASLADWRLVVNHT